MGEMLIFYSLAGLITLCSAMVVISRNPVSAAIYLVVDLFLLAGVFALLEAHFVAAIQVLVYTGAIVVLFLFVIMLLNLRPEALASGKMSVGEIVVLGITTVAFIAVAIMLAFDGQLVGDGPWTAAAIEAAEGNTFVVGMTLFTKYLWPFELASILILLAIIASIVIAKKDKTPTVTQGRKAAHGNR